MKEDERKHNQDKSKQDKQDKTGEYDESDSDWGFKSGSRGMAMETKIGLLLIVVLMGAFGFVVYKKMNKHDAQVEQTVKEESSEDDGNLGDPFGENENDAQHKHHQQDGRAHSHEKNTLAAIGGQSEPEDDDTHSNGGNPFSAAKGKHAHHDQKEHRHKVHGEHEQVSRDQHGHAGSGSRTSDHGSEVVGLLDLDEEELNVEQQGTPLEAHADPEANTEQHSHQHGDSRAHTQRAAAKQSDDVGQQAHDDHADDSFDIEPKTNNIEQHAHASNNPFGDDENDSVTDLDHDEADPFDNDDHGHHHDDDHADDRDNGQWARSSQDDTRQNSSRASSTTTVRRSAQQDTGLDDAHDDSHQRQQSPAHIHQPQTRQQLARARSQDGEETDGLWDGADKDIDYHHQHNSGHHEHDDHASRGAHSETGPVEDPHTGDRPVVYKVQANDNYWSISRKQYGSARYFAALSRYNRHRIPDPKKMRPGMKVLVPSPEVLVARYPDLFQGKSKVRHASGGKKPRRLETLRKAVFFRDRSGRPMVRVGRRDTLTGIAQKYLGRARRWRQIYELNRDRMAGPNSVKIGTVLRLPADASRVELVQDRQEYR